MGALLTWGTTSENSSYLPKYGQKNWKKEMDQWSKAYQCSRLLEQMVLNRRGPHREDLSEGAPIPLGEMLDQGLELDKRPPLSLIIEHCVVLPSREQNAIVNKAAMHLLTEELCLMQHLRVLRRYMLCESGHWLDQFSEMLFRRLHAGTRDGEDHWTSTTDLDNMLQASLKLCGDVDADPLTEHLSSSLLPEHSASALEYNISSTDCVLLSYQVEWPLNVILPTSALSEYSRVFSFLLKMKHVSYVLRDLWTMFQSLGSKLRSHRRRLRQLQILRLEIQHFVSAMLNSIISQVLQVAWQELLEKLASGVHTVQGLLEAHQAYLQSCVNRCLLNEASTPVRNIVFSILSLILKLRYQLLQDDPESLLSDDRFEDVLKMWRAFRKHTNFLYIVLSKQVEHTGDVHLQDLLMRLNFNNFYQNLDPEAIDNLQL